VIGAAPEAPDQESNRKSDRGGRIRALLDRCTNEVGGVAGRFTDGFGVTDKKIAPHIPVIDKSKRDDGTFSREDFTFDKERNVYICPAGKVLTTTGKLVNDGESPSPSGETFETIEEQRAAKPAAAA
jgi:hypothetical protein